MFTGRGLWLGYAIVFVSSACSLIVELVAGRILAPYIGVSLYTWTSIIGVVLAGISLGNYLGGRLADRWGSRGLLGLILLASGAASLAMLPATSYVATQTTSIPLIPKIVLFTALIFFVPSCLMGMVSPTVIKLSLADLRQTGNVVGKIYAISTTGSILGTFLTGFVLVSWLGTRTIVWVVAAVLIAAGLVAGDFWRGKRGAAAGLGAILIFSGALTYRGNFLAPCVAETNYYCINVFATTLPEIGDVKAIVLDHLVHSYVSEDPRKLGYGYERIYAELTEYAARRRGQPLRTLFVGGGGYTFPRYVEAQYPGSSVEVVEIDPGVTSAAHGYLGLPTDTRIKTYNEDARMFFVRGTRDGAAPSSGSATGRCGERCFDLVYGDAFNDLSVPYHLTTVEFDNLIRDRLGDDGYYLANVIDNPISGQFLKAFLRTMQRSFPNVYLLAQGELWNINSASTFVAAGTTQSLDRAELLRLSSENGRTPFSAVMPDGDLRRFLAGGDLALSDDFAPVDQLVAPLFVERGQ